VFDEPQLRQTGYFTELKANDGELRDLPGLPWSFEGGPSPYLTEAPVLGQHNAYVYQELLGLPTPEIDRMIEDQTIY
jgi:crotonobetainyl-CoA:carnitine CoA-transferase CaiB-like acyl-CoA transferase